MHFTMSIATCIPTLKWLPVAVDFRFAHARYCALAIDTHRARHHAVKAGLGPPRLGRNRD